MIAHVGAVPLEEILPALAGTSTGLVLVRAWLTLRLGRTLGGNAAAEARQTTDQTTA